jgi:hypothetical protein
LGDHGTLLQKENGIYRSLCSCQGITPSIGAEQKSSPLDSSLEDGDLEFRIRLEETNLDRFQIKQSSPKTTLPDQANMKKSPFRRPECPQCGATLVVMSFMPWWV